MVCTRSGGLSRRILTSAQVKRLLPHRDPFLFIDHALENMVGKSLVGVMKASPSLRFPPPRSVLLEAMGQAGALVVLQVRLSCSRSTVPESYPKAASLVRPNQAMDVGF